jgi:integrase/recombinase XerD
MYSGEHIASILGAAQGSLRLALLMVLKLGLRERELMFAEFADIDFHHGVFRVTGKPNKGFTIKGNVQREVPIPNDVLEALKARRAERPKARLIIGTKSDQPSTHLLRSLKRLAKRASLNCGDCAGCKGAAGVCREFTLHRLRRTYATVMLRNGFDARTVQGLLGHQQLSTVLRYLRPAAATETREKVNTVVW